MGTIRVDTDTYDLSPQPIVENTNNITTWVVVTDASSGNGCYACGYKRYVRK